MAIDIIVAVWRAIGLHATDIQLVSLIHCHVALTNLNVFYTVIGLIAFSFSKIVTIHCLGGLPTIAAPAVHVCCFNLLNNYATNIAY